MSDLTRDLIVGLYGGPPLGTGLVGVTIGSNASGVGVRGTAVDVSKSFTDRASTANYFNDQAVDLGTLSGPEFGGGVVNLAVTLRVTADAPNSGSFGHFTV